MTVILDRVVKNQALWEIHMRIRVESLEAGLESHRGWVFQNVTFLEDKTGEQLDNAGFETTMQTETEAGFALPLRAARGPRDRRLHVGLPHAGGDREHAGGVRAEDVPLP